MVNTLNTLTVKYLKRNRGFTLIEIMLAITISAIVAGGVYSTYSSQQKTFKRHKQLALMQQNLRASLAIMAREMREACYDPYEKANPLIVEASMNKFRFQYDRNNNGHAFNSCVGDYARPGEDWDPFEDIAYSLDTNNSDAFGNCTATDSQCILYRDTWPDGNTCTETSNYTKYCIADQIQSLTFAYYDSEDNLIDYDDLEGNSLDAQQNRNSIRSVLITMVARSDEFSTDDHFTKTATKRVNLRNM